MFMLFKWGFCTEEKLAARKKKKAERNLTKA
jgi:hypothetical protein